MAARRGDGGGGGGSRSAAVHLVSGRILTNGNELCRCWGVLLGRLQGRYRNPDRVVGI